MTHVLRLPLTVAFDSDWVVRSGMGEPGGADSTVLRDSAGLPYVPDSTLTQLLRDRAEMVAAALDAEPGDGPATWATTWADWVEVLFGGQAGRGRAPRPAAAVVTAARMPAAVIAAATRVPALAEATVVVRAGVARDHRTGITRPDHLRMVEVAVGGLDLYAGVEVHVDGWQEEQVVAALRLLHLAVAALDRVGGMRRRGLGRCHAWLGPATTDAAGAGQQIDLDDALSWLEDADAAARRAPTPPTPPDLTPLGWAVADAADLGDANGDGPGDGGVVELDCAVDLVTDTVVVDRVFGNVIRSRSTVPGTHLLGPVIGWLAAAGADAGSLAAAARAGRLVVGDATVSMGQRRAAPAPRTWMTPKGDRLSVINRAAQPAPGVQLRRLDRRWIANDGDGAVLGALELRLRTQNSIDDDAQRPSGEAGLFTSEAIPAGTRLRTRVLVPRRALADVDPDRLPAVDIRVGRSIAPDDGRARLSCAAARVLDPVDDKDRYTSRIRLWLVSDALARDTAGRPVTSPARLADWLRDLWQLESVTVETAASDTIPTAWTTSRREPWHRGWGLPRGSDVGLAAGSILTLDCTPAPSRAQVEQLRRFGLGERTAEGYGEVRVDDPATTGPAPGVSRAAVDGVPAAGVGDPEDAGTTSAPHPVLARLVERALRTWIRRRCAQLRPADVLGDKARQVPAAQIGALRALVQAAPADDAGIAALRKSWRRHVDRAAVREAWAGTHEQVTQLLTDPDRVWHILGHADDPDSGLDILAAVVDPDTWDQVTKVAWPAAVRSALITAASDSTRLRSAGGTR